MTAPRMADLAPDAFSSACPSRATLQHLTGRWGALTMAGLTEGPLRFGELRRRVEGISDKMLSQTLGQLERDGMVHRSAQLTIPPRVDYSLTPLGAEIADRLGALISLVESHMPEVYAAQHTFDEAERTAD